MRAAFPLAKRLWSLASVIESTTGARIRSAGLDGIANSTATFPNYYRLIHSEGVAGFSDDNLARLAQEFEDTTRL